MKKTLKVLSLFILMIVIATSCFATSEALNTTSTEVLDAADSEETLGEEEINYEDLLSAVPYDYQYGDIFSLDGSRLSSNTVVYGNVYIMGENINIDCTAIIGNLYVMGNDITIKAQEVTGNIYVMGNNVNIACEVVDTAVYAMGNTLELDVQTYHLYGAADKITVSETSQIMVDARLAGGEINFKGGVGNNLYTDCEELFLDDNSIVYGSTIEYTNNISAPEALQSKLVKKEGKVIEKTTGILEELLNKLKSLSLVMSIVFSIVVIFIITLAMRKSERYETDIKSHFLKDLALGFVSMIGICLLSTILMITILGVTAGLAILLAWVLLVIIATPVATIEFSKLILGDRAVSKIKVFILAVGLNVAICILEIVPVVGSIVSVICLFYGFGFTFRKIFGKKESNEDKTQTPVVAETTSEQNDIVKAIDEIEPEVIKEETPVITEEENNIEESKEEKDEE